MKNKKKSNNMVVIITKISQKMKNKSLLSIEKKYHRMRKKMLYYNYKKVFQFRQFCFSMRESLFFCTYVWKVLSEQTKNVKNRRNFWFSSFASFLLKYKMFFKFSEQFFKKYFWNVFFEGVMFENILINTYISSWLWWVITFTALNW